MRLICCYFTTFFITLTLSAQTMVDGCIVSSENTGSTNATNDYIHLYQNYISELKGTQCAMYPSCSNYGLIVYSDKNFFEATTLLCDRLIRCSHDRKFYTDTYKYGYRSLSDTPYYLDNNKKEVRASFPQAEILKHAKDSAILFINYLINEQEYSAALLEIERLHHIRKTLSPLLYLKKLQCLRGLGRHEKALYEYDVNFPAEVKETPDIIMELAFTNYLLTNYTATIALTQKIEETNSLFIKSRTLQALSLTRENRILEAKKTFTELATIFPENPSLNKNLQLAEKLINIKEKNSNIAKALSIIPGLGYLYAGHKGSAATSFFINSLLIYATYTSIQKENYGVAGIMGFFSLSFYIGNIKGAGQCVKRYNSNMRNNIITEIERRNNIYNY